MEQMNLPELDYMKHPERVKAKKRLNEAVDMLVTVFETDSPSLTYLLIFNSLIGNLKDALTNLAEVEANLLEDDIAELEALLNGRKPRKAVGVVIRDW